MRNDLLTLKMGGASLIALLSMVAAPDAKAAHIVDVTGTPGAGFTTWTFSGSDTAQSGSEFRVFPNADFGGGSSGDTTEMISPNDGDYISDPLISSQSFNIVSGSATITAGSTSQALGGLYVDDDPAPNGDDLGFRTDSSVLSYLSGDTISISGTVTIGVDINQLNVGSYLSSTTNGSQFLTDPLQLNIATTPEPSALIGLLAASSFGLLSRKKKQK